MERLERTTRLVGREGMARLRGATVAVCGLGGVGSFCAEALGRSGVGALRLVDHDVISETNCNRQIHALASTIGQPKVEAMGRRLLDVVPDLRLELRQEFFAADSSDALLGGSVFYVVDAIDALGPKVELLWQCQQRRIPVVTVLGAAARMDPTLIRVAPLEMTRVDQLAARVRKFLRRRGSVEGVVAVYSEEVPLTTQGEWPVMTNDLPRGRQRVIQPSMVMVPAAMGMAAAAHVVRQIVGVRQQDLDPVPD